MKRLLVIVWLLAALPSFGATYYVNPTGSGSTCSSGTPCSLTTGVTNATSPGDIVYLQDGTYNSSITVPASGSAGGGYISYLAVNDGAAIVDGQDVRVPFTLDTKSYINVEGINFRYSSGSVVTVHTADHINFKRCSAYRTADGNYSAFSFWVVTTGLIEDCVAGGRYRVAYLVLDSSYVTLRRNFTRFTEGVTYTSVGNGTEIYGSSNCLVENNFFIKNTGYAAKTFEGIFVWSADYSAAANNNDIYGNVIISADHTAYEVGSALKHLAGNHFKDNVSISSSECFRHAADGTLLVENLTCATASVSHYKMLSYYEFYTFEAGFQIAGTLRNSSFRTSGTGLYWLTADTEFAGLTHTYNNYYGLGADFGGNSTDDPTEYCAANTNAIDPAYNTATYGNGAYLLVPAALQGQGASGANVGAKVIYRYVDGTLTGTQLWPWPMEARILSEIGLSVTDMIWTTLNGVYPAGGSALKHSTLLLW